MPQGLKQQKIVIKMFQNIRELWTLDGSEGIYYLQSTVSNSASTKLETDFCLCPFLI